LWVTEPQQVGSFLYPNRAGAHINQPDNVNVQPAFSPRFGSQRDSAVKEDTRGNIGVTIGLPRTSRGSACGWKGRQDSINMSETAFEMAASSVRFGAGVTREIGWDLSDWGAKRVAVFTDSIVGSLPPAHTVFEVLSERGIHYAVFDRVRVEPTDASFLEAIAFAREGHFDAYVAVGGGSTIDTAKAANLYATWPADLLTYVNPPIGLGQPVPGPLKPLIAIPTTAGTGSETTGVSIFDYTPLHAKTGIASRRLKPSLGILDPENTRTAPPQVAASAGLDVLSHGIESYTALPFNERPRPERPGLRPAYQGSNPISDLWSLEALRLVIKYLPHAVDDPSDDTARSKMILAASYAGIGFGNAGVHLPHGMSYPVSGMVRDYRPAGYSTDHALVPHGVSVILNAPAVFRFTASACPERHLEVAALFGRDIARTAREDAGKLLADCLTAFMQRLKTPNGLRALGYTTGDIPALVKGTLPQHRVTKLSPRPASEEDLARLFEDAMVAW
jgi:hydroxyacid-oxoacid transhydrogenase